METIASFFLSPFYFPFMQKAFIMGILVASTCAIFSCFLILKGWSLMGDAISHSILPGLGVAYLLGLPLILGAFSAGIFSAFLISFIKENSRLKEDSIMGIVFSGMFALGLVFLTKIETDVHLLHVILGNILGLNKDDLVQILTISLLSISLFILKGKDFLLYCFDSIQAHTSGLSTKKLHFILLIFLSLIITSALKAVGIILVVAMLIIPGAIGFLLCKSFKYMLIISIASSFFSVFLGIVFSFHLDISPSPLIVCLQASIFAITLFTKKKNYEKVKTY